MVSNDNEKKMKKATDTPKFAEDFPERYMAQTPRPVKNQKTKVKKRYY
jgi:hypothetical protein